MRNIDASSLGESGDWDRVGVGEVLTKRVGGILKFSRR